MRNELFVAVPSGTGRFYDFVVLCPRAPDSSTSIYEI